MVYASEQKRKDIKARREEWQEQQKTMDQNHLVFLDESGVNLNMTRRYGRAIGKARVYDYVPLNTPRNTTLLSSIRIEDATMVHKEISGALNGVIFLEYIRNDLAPTLRQGDIVIMDNLEQFHKRMHISSGRKPSKNILDRNRRIGILNRIQEQCCISCLLFPQESFDF